MIENIILKNIASYDDIGTKLNDLKKINFIYGANGSGKTTISNLSENCSASEFKDCSLQWRHGQELQCLTYNKNFRENNFGKGSIEGVFTLGEATKEDLRVIQEKQEHLNTLKSDGLKAKDAFDKQTIQKTSEESEFKERTWKQIYKIHESNFKEAFKNSMQKESFKDRLLLESNEPSAQLQTLDELTKKSKTVFGDAPQVMDYLDALDFTRISDLEADYVWEEKIIGKSDVNISKLITSLNVNDWVNQGRAYISNDSVCPFCQQSTITDEFKNQLESYFDESFTASLKRVSELSSEYSTLKNTLINAIEQVESSQKLNADTKLKVDLFAAHAKTFLSIVNANAGLIAEKSKEPSRALRLTPTSKAAEKISELLVIANAEIKKHNDIVENFVSEKKSLIKDIWRYIVETNRADIDAYKRKMSGLERGLAALDQQVSEKRSEYKKLNVEIKDLTKNITSIQPTVDQINKTLKYYGFENFEIVPSSENKNHYQIRRENGDLAESTLSEGEITFITFLYYLQLAKGSVDKETITDERILVIDDPISSLDSNVLFVVGTLIKEIIKEVKSDAGNIKQVILLTHNVYFHKEASFIDGRTKVNSQTNFWILRKNNKVTSAQGFLTVNPIKTSYELLWSEIKEKNISSITVQNTMRRIIENYFKLLGGYKDSDLIKKFESQEEQEIFRSLVSWVNDGSHSISDDLFVEAQTDVAGKYLKVFRDIFVLTKHEGHYDMMMGIESGVMVESGV